MMTEITINRYYETLFPAIDGASFGGGSSARCTTGPLIWLIGKIRSAVGRGDKSEKGASGKLERRFGELIERYTPLIARICFSYAEGREEFEDLRQDVLINIWKGLGTFKEESMTVTWIYRVALNTCVSTIRKRSRRPETTSMENLLTDIADKDSDENMLERLETLHRLISHLTPVDKAIVTMWLDERSYDEIAEVTGISKGNVGLRLHRIRERWKLDVRGDSNK